MPSSTAPRCLAGQRVRDDVAAVQFQAMKALQGPDLASSYRSRRAPTARPRLQRRSPTTKRQADAAHKGLGRGVRHPACRRHRPQCAWQLGSAAPCPSRLPADHAARPWRQPDAVRRLDDVARAVLDALEGAIPAGSDIDLGRRRHSREPSPLTVAGSAFTPARSVSVPGFAAGVVSWLADLLDRSAAAPLDGAGRGGRHGRLRRAGERRHNARQTSRPTRQAAAGSPGSPRLYLFKPVTLRNAIPVLATVGAGRAGPGSMPPSRFDGGPGWCRRLRRPSPSPPAPSTSCSALPSRSVSSRYLRSSPRSPPCHWLSRRRDHAAPLFSGRIRSTMAVKVPPSIRSPGSAGGLRRALRWKTSIGSCTCSAPLPLFGTGAGIAFFMVIAAPATQAIRKRVIALVAVPWSFADTLFTGNGPWSSSRSPACGSLSRDGWPLYERWIVPHPRCSMAIATQACSGCRWRGHPFRSGFPA